MESKENLKDEKMILLAGVFNELNNVTFAVRAAQGHYGCKSDKDLHKEVLREDYEDRPPSFSNYFNFLNHDISVPISDSDNFSKGFLKSLIDHLRKEFPISDKTSEKGLESALEFVLEHQSLIKDEQGPVVLFCSILILGFIILPGIADDPRFDLAAMKALFSAGKVIERLKNDGVKRSDVPTKAGKAKRKGYIDEQLYFDFFYSMDVGKKSRNDVCKKIMEEAIKREKARAEAKNEKPEKVKSIKGIGEILKPKLDQLFK